MKRKTCMALAMMMGFCFSVNLFANVEGGDDLQKPERRRTPLCACLAKLKALVISSTFLRCLEAK
mgnify:CR=1 FL=1